MNTAANTIARAIRQHGVISFARFMELALYCPLCGFYEQEADNLGRRGDYFTSVSVGSLFGELLAFQFANWLSERGTQNAERGNRAAQIVEAGAHDGRLARDILRALHHHRPEVFADLEYWIVEPSPRRTQWQRAMLREFAPKVQWFADFGAIQRLLQNSVAADMSRRKLQQMARTDVHGYRGLKRAVPSRGNRAGELPRSAFRVPRWNGIVFSNEVLDAMPVRRLGWDARAKAWFEWGVALDGEHFVWARLSPCVASPESPAELVRGAGLNPPLELLEVLPDEFTLEVCPAASDWWRDAARALERGKLLTIDYGLTADEFLAPHRRHGTLRAYRQHRVSGDVLANPGQQDLTAHVNFTALQAAGEAAGLRTESFTTQAQFLVRIAERTWREPAKFGAWDAGRLRQFKTLTHPEHLGRPFRVLVQAR